MSNQPTWRLTDEEIEAIGAQNAYRYLTAYVRGGADAQSKALVEWLSQQLFDDDNMDESLDMLNGVIVGPRWLVQLRKDVGLP